MDSLTHIAVGACLGEAIAGKQLGRKAMLWGALAHSLPDVDFIAGFWMDTAEEMLAHRGFSHSLFFVLVFSPLLALLGQKLPGPKISFWRWTALWTAGMLLHLALDVCNNYGTGLLEPFSHQRFSIHLLYVADPLFSFAPAIAALLLLKKSLPPVRRRLWMTAFAWCAIYCGIAAFNKQSVSNTLRQSLQQQGLSQQRMFITPSPLNTLLWYAVAGNDSGYHVAFHSVLDADSSQIAWQYFPSNRHWLDTIADHEDLQHLIRFSQEFYTVEKWGDSLVFNDLRFGQMLGWQQPRGRFVFHYYLQHPTENDVIVQRGRFKGWNKTVALALLRRMVGQR